MFVRLSYRDSEYVVDSETPDTRHWTLHVTGAILAVAFIAASVSGGAKSVLLLTLSILPVVVIFTVTRTWCAIYLSLSLILEMFWLGALVSVCVANVLEIIIEEQTRKVWRCEARNPSVLCDLRFVVVMIVGIGFVEELSKLIPLSRFVIGAKRPACHSWWFRVIRTPQAVALAGLWCATGFATIENVKYVMKSEEVVTAGLRAVMAIPFHLACTTYGACLLAQFYFKPSSSNAMTLATPMVTPTPLQYLGMLAVPSLLHGLYDVGLVLSFQMYQLSQGFFDSTKLSDVLLAPTYTRLLSSLYFKLPTMQMMELSTEGDTNWFDIGFSICLSVSLGSYVLMLILASRAYTGLKQLESGNRAEHNVQLLEGSQAVLSPFLQDHWVTVEESLQMESVSRTQNCTEPAVPSGIV